ncbi:MAG: hypothetical protein ACKVP7_06060 [Hyphomicrobiaceae bacterium]
MFFHVNFQAKNYAVRDSFRWSRARKQAFSALREMAVQQVVWDVQAKRAPEEFLPLQYIERGDPRAYPKRPDRTWIMECLVTGGGRNWFITVTRFGLEHSPIDPVSDEEKHYSRCGFHKTYRFSDEKCIPGYLPVSGSFEELEVGEKVESASRGTAKSKFFISYSRTSDRDADARRMVRVLAKYGYDVFYDLNDIKSDTIRIAAKGNGRTGLRNTSRIISINWHEFARQFEGAGTNNAIETINIEIERLISEQSKVTALLKNARHPNVWPITLTVKPVAIGACEAAAVGQAYVMGKRMFRNYDPPASSQCSDWESAMIAWSTRVKSKKLQEDRRLPDFFDRYGHSLVSVGCAAFENSKKGNGNIIRTCKSGMSAPEVLQ